MKKAKNLSALILVSAMLCYWGGVLIGCDNDSGSGTRPNPGITDPGEYDTDSGDDLEEDFDEELGDYLADDLDYDDENVYADDFYSTEYKTYYVRDVYRSPANPSASDKTLTVYYPDNPYLPDYNRVQYTDAQLKNIRYFVLEKAKSGEKDCYDEYAVSLDGKKEKIGTDGRIMCFGKEGFLFLCGGTSGMDYGTFFFTKYGYSEFKRYGDNLTYEYENLNLGHDDVSEIFGAATK